MTVLTATIDRTLNSRATVSVTNRDVSIIHPGRMVITLFRPIDVTS